MRILVQVGFRADVSLRPSIERIMSSFDLALTAGDEPPAFAAHETRRSFQIDLVYDPSILDRLLQQLRSLDVGLLGHSYSFHVSDEEYAGAPLYRLQGVGNTSRAYIPSQGTLYRWIRSARNVVSSHES